MRRCEHARSRSDWLP